MELTYSPVPRSGKRRQRSAVDRVRTLLSVGFEPEAACDAVGAYTPEVLAALTAEARRDGEAMRARQVLGLAPWDAPEPTTLAA